MADIGLGLLLLRKWTGIERTQAGILLWFGHLVCFSLGHRDRWEFLEVL